uniref:importin-13-like n=1 Tax=Ciona intestinalis TaxID=7719 RepID=UPI000180C49C|nr:importin-13-like [Ciona intestinalis]|eukprot:XP_002128195.1 importin-13-like [Ciona intestinalis]
MANLAPDFTCENIEKALHELYYNPSMSCKDTAQKWLMKAQRSPQAWQFAWKLLEEGKSTEVQHFGASSLASKISGAWKDVGEDDVEVLKDKLFEQLFRFAVSLDKKIILTRLCVAFSAFVFNCANQQLWINAIHDVIERVKEETKVILSNDQRCLILLEILTVLPEECHSANTEKYKKGNMMHVLISGFSQVIVLLNSISYQNNSVQIKNRVIKCLSSWVTLGTPLNECEELLITILGGIHQTELFDAAVDCLLNTFCSPRLHDYPNTIKKLVPLVLSLHPIFTEAVGNENSDMILGLTKVVCSLAENHTKFIIDSISDHNGGWGLICFVMDCLVLPLQYPTSENSSPISFTFWYSLQDEIQGLQGNENITMHQQLSNVYFQLVTHLLTKAKYPQDNSHNEWTADEKEQHRIYRIDISDTLMYLLEMLHTDVLHFIMQQLHAAMEQSAASTEHWHDIETCLFGIHSIVETLTETNAQLDCLQSLVNIIPKIHVNSLQLADTLLYTIGSLTEWLRNHPENLQILMSIVLPYLNNNELSLSTVLTLRRLTSECCEHLTPFTPSILQQIGTLLIKGVLRNNEETWLMQSAGYLLSVLPQAECLKYLQSLLTLNFHQLEALSKDTQSIPTKNSIIHILDLLAHLFCTLDRRQEDENGEILTTEEHPVVIVLRQLTPIIKNILEHWVSDISIMEAFCNLYDKSIRNLISGFSPLLAPLCEMLTTILKIYPHTSVLDLAQQIVLVFGADVVHKKTVSMLISAIVQVVLPIYGKGVIKDHPDIGHSFLRLLSYTSRKQSELFKLAVSANNQFNIVDVFHCASITLGMSDSESAKVGSSFFVDVLSLYSSDINIQKATSKLGRDLVALVLHGVGGNAPRTHIDNYADILQALCRHNNNDFSKWLHELAVNSTILPAEVSQTRKEYFCKQLLQSSKSKKRCRDVVKDFTLVCRGLHGTEYVAG